MPVLDQWHLNCRGACGSAWRSPWLLGDWTPGVRDPIDLVRLSFLGGAVVTVLLGEWEQSLRLALTFGVTIVARLMKLPRPFDLAFNVAMAWRRSGCGCCPTSPTCRGSTSGSGSFWWLFRSA